MESRFYCEHCGEKVSKTLYYQHKKLYYVANKQQWKRTAADEEVSHHSASEDEDFTFSDQEDSNMEVRDEDDMAVDDYIPVESSEDGDVDDSDEDFSFNEVSQPLK